MEVEQPIVQEEAKAQPLEQVDESAQKIDENKDQAEENEVEEKIDE